MYLAEKEIRNQFDALDRTFRYITGQRAEIYQFLEDIERICVLGCGSSYSTAKSSALHFAQQTGIASWAIAAGDLLVNFGDYTRLLENSSLLLLSRSGSTSELLLAVQKCRELYPDIRIISICAVENAPISHFADFGIEIPWAFDHSICQTRTVSNLYMSALLLSAIKGSNEKLIEDLKSLKLQSERFVSSVETILDDIAIRKWRHATLLADSGLAGITEEGALVFKEICLTRSNFYNVLDVRHGPIVTVGSDSLVAVYLTQGDEQLQVELVKDISNRTQDILVFSSRAIDPPISYVTTIILPAGLEDNVNAIFMLYCIQLLCFKRALALGLNPDAPEGLDAWIRLEI